MDNKAVSSRDEGLCLPLAGVTYDSNAHMQSCERGERRIHNRVSCSIVTYSERWNKQCRKSRLSTPYSNLENLWHIS